MLGFAQPVGKPAITFEPAQQSIQMRQRKEFEEWRCSGLGLVVSVEVQTTMLGPVRKLISFEGIFGAFISYTEVGGLGRIWLMTM